MIDGTGAEAQSEQLRPRYNPVLAADQLPDIRRRISLKLLPHDCEDKAATDPG